MAATSYLAILDDLETGAVIQTRRFTNREAEWERTLRWFLIRSNWSKSPGPCNASRYDRQF
jgi:hypothetical protein